MHLDPRGCRQGKTRNRKRGADRRAPGTLPAAVVEERAPACRAIFPEAVRPAGRVRVLAELRRVHPLDRRRLENARALERTAAKVRDEESRHVGGGRREAAGRRDLQHIEWQRALSLSHELVGDRPPALRVHRQREAARLHTQRLEDVLAHVVGKRAPRHLLDEQSCERKAVVRVAEDAARRDEGRRHRTGEVEAERILLGRRSRGHPGNPIVEAGGVRQQVMQRDRTVRRRQMEPGQVVVDVAVEIEAALFDQLHHRGGGYQLRHRRDTEDGALWINRTPRIQPRPTVAMRGHQLSAGHHRQHQSGNPPPGHLGWEEGVGEPHHGIGVHARLRFRCLRRKQRRDARREGNCQPLHPSRRTSDRGSEFDAPILRNCRAGWKTVVTLRERAFSVASRSRRQPEASVA